MNENISEATIGAAVKTANPKIHGERKIQPQMRCWRISVPGLLAFVVLGAAAAQRVTDLWMP